MYDLPLFPLNTVLFPGMPLTLHIFEERYKQMVSDCLTGEKRFGVVLIREGVESMGPLAVPYSIGCTAEIAHVQPLSAGRMNLLAVGKERFRIVSLQDSQPYLMGTVEPFPLHTLQSDDAAASIRLRPWVEEYVALLSEVGEVEFDGSQLPDDPEALAYLAATVLQVPGPQKQELLAAAGAGHMLNEIYSLYRRELPLLRLMLQERAGVPAGPGPFSLN